MKALHHLRILFCIPACFSGMLFISETSAQDRQDEQAAKPVVLLDNYYNHELNKKTGKVYHYTWEDTENSGFSGWGRIFIEEGFNPSLLEASPTKGLLDKAEVYIIVDPDNTRESTNPNYVDEKAIKEISQWVKKGGILMMMANDSGNCEFMHFNQLAAAFGFQFKEARRNVPGAGNADMEKASFRNLPDHPFFKGIQAVFIKEICTLDLEDRSCAIFSEGGDDLIAVIPYGKGQVVAIPDPWFYNEYLNGEPKCRLTDEYQNNLAARNIARWLFQQIKNSN